MTFDLDTTFEGMKDRAQQSTQELRLGYGIGNTSEKQEVEPGTRVLPTIPGSLLCNLDRHAGDRYQRKGRYFVESTTRNTIAFSEVSTRLRRELKNFTRVCATYDKISANYGGKRRR